MSVTLQLDSQSRDHLNKQFALLQQAGPRSVYSSIMKISFKIVAEAQLRLRGKGHIVTSRLRNSIFTKTKTAPKLSYSDTKGGSYVSELQTVTLGDSEVAIGTNVEYAEKIENMDSFLMWALQNVDIERSISEDSRNTMENVMKFGTRIIPANQRP